MLSYLSLRGGTPNAASARVLCDCGNVDESRFVRCKEVRNTQTL